MSETRCLRQRTAQCFLLHSTDIVSPSTDSTVFLFAFHRHCVSVNGELSVYCCIPQTLCLRQRTAQCFLLHYIDIVSPSTDSPVFLVAINRHFSTAQQPTSGLCRLIAEFSRSHTIRHTTPVHLLRTNDQPVAQAATYKTNNTHKGLKSIPSAGFELSDHSTQAASILPHGHWNRYTTNTSIPFCVVINECCYNRGV